jgi:hypothetical protein
LVGFLVVHPCVYTGGSVCLALGLGSAGLLYVNRLGICCDRVQVRVVSM